LNSADCTGLTTAAPPGPWFRASHRHVRCDPSDRERRSHSQAPEGAINSAGVLFLTLGDEAGPNNMLNGEVWKFDPSTLAWTNITPPGALSTGGQGGFVGIDVDAQQPNTVVTSTFDRWGPIDTVYLSRDAGATWKDLGALVKGDTDGATGWFPFSVTAKSPWLAWGASRNSAGGCLH